MGGANLRLLARPCDPLAKISSTDRYILGPEVFVTATRARFFPMASKTPDGKLSEGKDGARAPPMVDVASIDVSPNACSVDEKLQLSMRFSVDAAVTDAARGCYEMK